MIFFGDRGGSGVGDLPGDHRQLPGSVIAADVQQIPRRAEWCGIMAAAVAVI